MESEILAAAQAAKSASLILKDSSSQQRNAFLAYLKEAVWAERSAIMAANQNDYQTAAKSGSRLAYLDRLALNENRIKRITDSLEAVAALPDPLNRLLWKTVRPNGLVIQKVSVPIGVLAIIYEARPDVTVEAASLCLKSGNTVILKGGSDSLETNLFLEEIIQGALRKAGLPVESVVLVKSRQHAAVDYLLTLSGYIDLVIPRGGEALIRSVVEKSRIPVIKHYKGVCHTYVDRDADLEVAWRVTRNAKVQRPATCNATETLLVHHEISERFLPEMGRIFQADGVEMRACPESQRYLPNSLPAKETDWGCEFSDTIIAIKTVYSLEEAIAWINRYGTGHSEAIITQNKESAERFLQAVDAAAVYHNASTRFTDGFEFGLGAEIGISTDKIHARGPMGLQELTSYKYLIWGNGQVRQ